MSKIGLFLEGEPSGGGTFQYTQTMLEAVAALPSDQFSVVVGYASEAWLAYLGSYNLKVVHIPRGVWARAFGLGWALLGLPMRAWHTICPFFHPMVKTLLREQCDLWIFPAHNLRSYQFPVPALVAIHDLMFRYEKRFPEFASRWEYLNRERSCRNICRWSKGVLVDLELGRKQMVESYDIAAAHVHVLPYIAPKYMFSAEVPPDFEERYQLPAKFIFYPAQFWAHKNHKNLLEAIARLKIEIPGLKAGVVRGETKCLRYGCGAGTCPWSYCGHRFFGLRSRFLHAGTLSSGTGSGHAYLLRAD